MNIREYSIFAIKLRINETLVAIYQYLYTNEMYLPRFARFVIHLSTIVYTKNNENGSNIMRIKKNEVILTTKYLKILINEVFF